MTLIHYKDKINFLKITAREDRIHRKAPYTSDDNDDTSNRVNKPIRNNPYFCSIIHVRRRCQPTVVREDLLGTA